MRPNINGTDLLLDAMRLPDSTQYPDRPGYFPQSGDGGFGRSDEYPGLVRDSNAQDYKLNVTVAVTPQMPIPAAPLLLPATPGYGSWGTES